MSKKPNQEHSVSQKTYVQLSRLAHESFAQRRNYEWKMNFGFWGAIGVIIFAATKEKIPIFHNCKEAITIGVILSISYLLHIIMVNRGHAIDKKLKHYYMAKAACLPESEIEKSKWPDWLVRILWTIPYCFFTGALIYLAINVLLHVKCG